MSATVWQAVLLRDIAGMRTQIAAYGSDAQVWECPPPLPNSSGTLAIHLAGNLMHFVGAVMGKTGYVRDRDAEFASRDLPRAEIDRRLTEAAEVVARVLPRLTDADLERPIEIAGVTLPARLALGHLAAHLAYHLGQMDYHRRIVTGSTEGLGMIGIKGFSPSTR